MTPTSTSIALAIGLLLVACAGNSPEATGQRLAEKKCACDQIDRDDELKRYAAVLESMESDPALTPEDAKRISSETVTDADREASREREKQCKEEGEKMAEQAHLDFPRQEDRQTIENAVEDRIKICKRDHKEKRKEFDKAIELLMK